MSRTRILGAGSLAAAAGWLVFFATHSAVCAGLDDSEPKSGQGKEVARCVSETAYIMRRAEPGKPWQVVAKDEAIRAGDLLVGMPGATLDSKNGAVRVEMMSDLEGLSPFPVMDNAIRLHDTPGVDLDMTLDRGRVDLVNRKDRGPAQVKVRVRQETWDLTLEEPCASIALELYGRWAPGVPFTKEPGPKDVPIADLIFLVLKGEVKQGFRGVEHELRAPPGPAMITWDNVDGHDSSPHRLEKLPPWAEPTKGEDSPLVQAKKAALERFRTALLSKPVETVLEEFVQSNNPGDRRLAVIAMAAFDDLANLGKALREGKQPDVWDNGVIALRHWIGRGPGQDQLLYKRLVEVAKCSPVEAEDILQLLHSFSPEEVNRPETYEMLIDHLDHNRLAVRGLANWHLVRLVPAGKEFGYNPMGSKEERKAAIDKWRKLIPPGQLPPKRRPNAEQK
jgi:hypothetical protein